MARKRKDSNQSYLEEQLLFQIRAVGLPEPEREQRFHKTRKWLADLCYLHEQIIIEAQGGTYQHMGHSTGAGIHRDYEKSNEAQLAGFLYLQFDATMIKDGSALSVIERALASRRKEK